ncbi:uncharacterized protein LOC106129935 [Amyelois transitella]|uniref:uncharacterized protein LOC106129935 n=1 Tax=Amyelois transitella TaxID=680683 RepID=UPI00067CA898|nr:uncharacterized protein LOC106129935 [Amyelois transitella]
MPLHAIGWSKEEDHTLVELIQPHKFLYNVLDPSRKNIIARETTWQEIAQVLSKPVEECKKRWRGLRDSYTRSKRVGAMHKTKIDIFEKLQFLDECTGETADNVHNMIEVVMEQKDEDLKQTEQQVITDNQEYYEITVVDGPQETQLKPFIKLVPSNQEPQDEQPAKKRRSAAGRKKAVPIPKDIPPVKILPKPVFLNGPKLVRYVNNPKTPEQRSQVVDKLIEKVLKEHTNEIDVFFRSMAASVKKLQPNLIPKVKMEVCNVIAKYEMQSFEKKTPDF